MTMNYRVADLATRIRNGQAARLAVIHSPASKLLANLLEVLKGEGYIADYTTEEVSKGRAELVVTLKYHENEPVIKEIKVRSKPGRRLYNKISKLKHVQNGLGISILSTSKGVMSDAQAREANVGGEVLCTVF